LSLAGIVDEWFGAGYLRQCGKAIAALTISDGTRQHRPKECCQATCFHGGSVRCLSLRERAQHIRAGAESQRFFGFSLGCCFVWSRQTPAKASVESAR